jgi:hypothetical protein
VSAKKPKRERQNGRLKIELGFEDAVRAALETPAPKTERRKRPKSRGRPKV